MRKYSILGIFNFLLGLGQIVLPIICIAVVIPRLTLLYSEFVTMPPSFYLTYLILGLVIFMGIANLFIAFKLFAKTEKYFKYGIILAIATFILTGIFMVLANFWSIYMIYNLPAEF
ncbi:hypothetical protein AMJ51_01405 [Microgenomates bacterium DG_75]|nr:MAG: hypothetical protein AMJ51_01405 [Microgenomates bacterium DG_75]